MKRSVLLLGLGTLALVPRSAWAHGTALERSAQADQLVHAHPGDPGALIARARLALDTGYPDEAVVDLEHAARVVGGCGTGARVTRCREIDLVLAEAWMDAGDDGSAVDALERVLSELATEPRALYLRSRIAEREGRHRDAARDLAVSLAETREPAASAYLELSRLHVAAGDDDEAMRVLEQAATRHGALAVVVDAAVDLDVRRGRFGEALAWTDRWEERMRSSPSGRAVRAELLLSLGRATDAEAEASLGLSDIEALPSARRSSMAIVAVRTRLEAAVEAARALASRAPAAAPPSPGTILAGLAAAAALFALGASALRRSGRARST